MRVDGVVLIVLDAVRKDVFERCVELGLVRNLAKLYHGGIYFPSAYTPTNITDPALTTMLTGLHPLDHGLINHGPEVTPLEMGKVRNVRSLPRVLSKRGFVTVSIDFLERWYKDWFDIYITRTRFFRDRRYKIGLLFRSLLKRIDNAPLVLRRILRGDSPASTTSLFRNPHVLLYLAMLLIEQMLEKHRNFFILIHNWSTHVPYTTWSFKIMRNLRKIASSLVPRGVEDRDLVQVLEEIGNPMWRNYLEKWFVREGFHKVSDVVASYYAALMEFDSAFGDFLKFLEDQGLLDRVLIIVTSDHGESLGEHGIYFDHHGLYEVSLRVPFVLYFEPLGRGIAKGTLMHVDVPYIVSEILNLRYDISGTVHGYGLSNLMDSDPRENDVLTFLETYTEAKIAFKFGEYKLIRSLGIRESICKYCMKIHGGLVELYNLRKDPSEVHNVYDSYDNVVKLMTKLTSKEFVRFRALYTMYKRGRLRP